MAARPNTINISRRWWLWSLAGVLLVGCGRSPMSRVSADAHPDGGRTTVLSGGTGGGAGGVRGSGGVASSGGMAGAGGSSARGGAGGSSGRGGAGGSGGRGGTGGASARDGGAACQGRSIVASEANNYSFSSTLGFPPITVAPRTELTFDWSAVTADFLGHAVDPKKDIASVAIHIWGLTPSEFATKVNADTLTQRDLVVVPFFFATGNTATSARLFEFTLSGGTVDPAIVISYFDASLYPPANTTYALLASTGTTIGAGTRMIQTFQLDPASTNATVKMTKDSTKLTYTVDLHSLTPTAVAAGEAPLYLDWSALKTNAMGNAFDPTMIAEVLVGHYPQGSAELEQRFLDLELIASELYRAAPDMGTSFNFLLLRDAAGKSFPGIDSTGTWLVALRCGLCRNPAPWYLSILKPC